MDSWEKQLRYLLQSLDAIRDAILELKPTTPPPGSQEGEFVEVRREDLETIKLYMDMQTSAGRVGSRTASAMNHIADALAEDGPKKPAEGELGYEKPRRG